MGNLEHKRGLTLTSMRSQSNETTAPPSRSRKKFRLKTVKEDAHRCDIV